MKYLLILACFVLAACATAKPQVEDIPGTTADVTIVCAKQHATITGTSVHLFDGSYDCDANGNVVVKPSSAKWSFVTLQGTQP